MATTRLPNDIRLNESALLALLILSVGAKAFVTFQGWLFTRIGYFQGRLLFNSSELRPGRHGKWAGVTIM